MNKSVIIMGDGGHAKVLTDLLQLLARKIIGYTSTKFQKEEEFFGIKCLGNDSVIEDYAPEEIKLVNAIAAMPRSDTRREIGDKMRKRGYQFATLIHPSAIVAKSVIIEEGVQIMAGSVIQSGTKIGIDSIINTNASIDHDCSIGKSVHIAPGVTMSGNVTIDDYAHVGTGTSIIQGIKIGKASIIAAGSVIYSDVVENHKFIQHKSELPTQHKAKRER